MTETGKDKIRLDKWLWAARFYKTRNLAKEAIESGKVQYNDVRAKASKDVEMGALIRLRTGWDEKVVVVKNLSGQRRSAQEAQWLYEETAESVQYRQEQAELRKHMQQHLIAPATKPNKKERRQIHQFKEKSTE